MKFFNPIQFLILSIPVALAFPMTITINDISSVSESSAFEQLVNLPGEKPIPGDSPVAQCDIFEPQLLTIDRVSISPNPPEKGANLSFSATGSLAKSITDGAYVVVNVRYGYIKLLEKTFDLCEELVNVDMTCPVSKGAQLISKTVEIPAEVPPGKYTVYARAFTEDDVYISCLTATVTFSADASLYGWLDYAKFVKGYVLGF